MTFRTNQDSPGAAEAVAKAGLGGLRDSAVSIGFLVGGRFDKAGSSDCGNFVQMCQA